MEELKRIQENKLTNSLGKKLRKSAYDGSDLMAQISTLQERTDFLKNSREFQEVDSVCSGRLCHVPF